jgi:hypothetical protein
MENLFKIPFMLENLGYVSETKWEVLEEYRISI